MIPIKDLMTTEVIVIAPNDRMTKVHDIFHSHDIHHLPVLNQNQEVVGILSKTDYLTVSNAFPLFKTEAREKANQKLFQTLLVEDVMTRQVATLLPDDSISIAASFFRENLFRAVPVVDEKKKLVGILTTYDLLNYFFSQPLLLSE